jgi:hypothetical protein
MNHIVHGMAIAAKYNMTFAGAVIQPEDPTACTWDSFGHTESNTWPSVCSLFQGVFRVNSALDVLITQLPSNVTVLDNVRQLMDVGQGNASKADALGPNSVVYLKQDWLGDLDGKQSEFFTPGFLKSFREIGVPLSVWPLKFRNTLPRVAVHLRRGDLPRDNGGGNGRWTDDNTTLALLHHITTRLGPADVHLWSSNENKYYTSEDFDVYRSKGVHVHLDGEIMEAWAHFARADIFVQATSSFSYLPALANPRCVIYQQWWTLEAVDAWLDVTTWKREFSKGDDNWNATWDAKLDECFARFRQRSHEPSSVRSRVSLQRVASDTVDR